MSPFVSTSSWYFVSECRVVIILNDIYRLKNLGQYDRPRILGCEPVDGVLVVLSSNQINIASFVHQMEDTHMPHLVNKYSNMSICH